MKLFVTLTMALSLMMGGVTAQNKNTAKNKHDSQTAIQIDKEQKWFRGVIYYQTKDKLELKSDFVESTPERITPDMNNTNRSNKLAQNVKPKGFFLSAIDEKCSYMQLNSTYRLFWPEKMFYQQGVTIPDGQIFYCDGHLCENIREYCESLEHIKEAQRNDDLDEANRLLSDIYKRTDQTKQLAGQRVVLYDVNLPEVHGAIWVAEELWIEHWQAPFWGLQHPVLEFDLTYSDNAVKGRRIHLVAERIENTDDVAQYYKEYIELTQQARPVTYEEFDNMIKK